MNFLLDSGVVTIKILGRDNLLVYLNIQAWKLIGWIGSKQLLKPFIFPQKAFSVNLVFAWVMKNAKSMQWEVSSTRATPSSASGSGLLDQAERWGEYVNGLIIWKWESQSKYLSTGYWSPAWDSPWSRLLKYGNQPNFMACCEKKYLLKISGKIPWFWQAQVHQY